MNRDDSNVMEDLADVQYGDRHRAFLQALMARGTMTFEESKPLLSEIMNAENDEQAIRPEEIGEDEFQEYIQIAGRAASLFDYEIRNTLHQITKQRVYSLVNTTSDPQTQLATTFANDELSFIKRVLDAMFDKYNTPRMEVLAITSMQAMKMARPNRRQSQVPSETQSQMPIQTPTQMQSQVDPDSTQAQQASDRGLKHSEVESVLQTLVGGGWFEKSRDGFFALTPRALLELRPWLVSTFNDPDAETHQWQRIKFCAACKDIVTYGLRCSNPDCTLRLHDHCQDAFWRSKRSKNCIICSEEWTGSRYIGERAVTTTEAYRRGKRQSGGRRTDLAEQVVQQNQGSEAEDEGEDEDQPSMHAATQISTQGATQQSENHVDEDEE